MGRTSGRARHRRPAPELPGLGRSCVRWQDATPAELRLLLSAIRRGWPVPAERRGPILADIAANMTPADQRRTLLVVRILLAADRANRSSR